MSNASQHRAGESTWGGTYSGEEAVHPKSRATIGQRLHIWHKQGLPSDHDTLTDTGHVAGVSPSTVSPALSAPSRSPRLRRARSAVASMRARLADSAKELRMVDQHVDGVVVLGGRLTEHELRPVVDVHAGHQDR